MHPRLHHTPWRVLLVATSLAAVAPRPVTAQASGPLRIYSRSDSAQLQRDLNGFLLNPRWFGDTSGVSIESRCRFRTTLAHLAVRSLVTTEPNCLSDDEKQLVTVNEAVQSLTLGTECVTSSLTGQIRGHVNWFPVTATGQVVWNDFSAGIMDHDMNMDLFAPAPNATTTFNAASKDYGYRRPYHTETYFDETFARFNQMPPFWTALVEAKTKKALAGKLVNDRFAILTGLYNVDGVHGFHAELHPVYAMSVLLGVTRVDGGLREEWAVMVRNNGGQGDCASGMQPMLISDSISQRQRFSIDLGGWVGGGVPVVEAADVYSTAIDSLSSAGTDSLSYAVMKGTDGASHAVLTVRQPRPEVGVPGSVVLATVYVQWPATDIAAWRKRFDSMLPAYTHPDLRLDPVRGDRRPAALPLDTVTPRPLRVYKAAPWPTAAPVNYFDCEHTPKGVCNERLRWIAGATAGGWTIPYAGHFRYPHSFYDRGEGTWAGIKNIWFTLGEIWEVRPESFSAYKTSGDTTILDPRQRGATFRFSPYVSPTDVHLGTSLSLTPIAMGGIGMSWLDRQYVPFSRSEFGITWNWGWGMIADFRGHTIFLNQQVQWRAGHYQSYTTYNLGILRRRMFLLR
jgi:hypothetical protein